MLYSRLPHSVLLLTSEPILWDGFKRAITENSTLTVHPGVAPEDAPGEPPPEIVVIDHRAGKPFATIQIVRSTWPSAKIALWTRSISTSEAFEALAMGSRAIIAKTESGPRIAEILQQIAAGETYIDKRPVRRDVVGGDGVAATPAAAKRLGPEGDRKRPSLPTRPSALPARAVGPLPNPGNRPIPLKCVPPVSAMQFLAREVAAGPGPAKPPTPVQFIPVGLEQVQAKPDKWARIRVTISVALGLVIVAPFLALTLLEGRLPSAQVNPKAAAPPPASPRITISPTKAATLLIKEAHWCENRQCIEGELENIGTFSHTDVSVSFRLRTADEQETLVSGVVKKVEPHQTAPFRTTNGPKGGVDFILRDIRLSM